MGFRSMNQVEELKGMMETYPHIQEWIEGGIEYIEESEHYGDPVDPLIYQGVVDFLTYMGVKMEVKE